jgi:DNA-directed RNA polymerase II subunit RPB2
MQMVSGYIQQLAGRHYNEDLFHPLLLGLEYDNPEVTTELEAILYISGMFGKALQSTGMNVLKSELFPHLGPDFTEKLYYLCICTVWVFLFKKGLVASTPRDDYSMSQITTSAGHMGSMFRLLFISHMRTCGKLLRRMVNKDVNTVDVSKVYGEHRISGRVMSAVASGMWSAIRKGVSINLNTNNFDAIESQLRRISSSLATTSGNHTVPRNVMSDQYGFVCAASSPDGESTGLIYEIGLTATISPPVTDLVGLTLVIQTLLGHLIVPTVSWINRVSTIPDADSYLYVDAHGSWKGCIADPEAFIYLFLKLRRSGGISPFVFIERNRDMRTIRVTYQEGILCRPLLIAGQQDRICETDSVNRSVARGVLEYVSPAQQTTLCCIAVSLETITSSTTHVELTQASFLGKLASSVAYATGQQGPRLAYSTLQRKQIITGGSKRFRGANETNQLWNTHRPLVRTKTMEFLPESSSIHRGVPVVLALMSMPQNQEDAIIIKRSTLQRGAFMMSDHREYTSEAPTPCPTRSERFECPAAVISKKNVSYDCIGDSGVPVVGTRIPGGSVVIGKTRLLKRTSISKNEVPDGSSRKCDISTCTKKTDDGTVTHVDRASMPNGTRVRVVVTSTRTPDIGDKFTSQYAQKGVVGGIWEDVDMPFSMRTGVSPDMIVSPLSMTSRMTMSSMLEALCGKTVSVSGDYAEGLDDQDYQVSNQRHQKRFDEILRRHGFAGDGTEWFIDGRTGEKIKARIFVGVVEYFRLVHIASKKIHARSTGPRDPLTRQPRDGRRFGGGLRIGEMESSALAAHGSSRVLQERFRELSDSFEIYVCSSCQSMCDDVCRDIDYHFCRRCQSDVSVRSVLVPFTFLVLTLELLSTGIVTKFVL